MLRNTAIILHATLLQINQVYFRRIFFFMKIPTCVKKFRLAVKNAKLLNANAEEEKTHLKGHVNGEKFRKFQNIVSVKNRAPLAGSIIWKRLNLNWLFGSNGVLEFILLLAEQKSRTGFFPT